MPADRVLSGLDFIFVYLDDVIIDSQSKEEHLQHFRILFHPLSEASLVINSEKCVFGVAAVKFLGHHVTATGRSPTAAYLETIQRLPRPNTGKKPQNFLGTVNFCPSFFSGYGSEDPAASHRRVTWFTGPSCCSGLVGGDVSSFPS
jgi:hypothetical protein